MAETKDGWCAQRIETPLGNEVSLITPDGARIILHRDIARELGNCLRGAADECDVVDARAARQGQGGGS